MASKCCAKKITKNKCYLNIFRYYRDLPKKTTPPKNLHSKCRICLQEGSIVIFEKEIAGIITETLQYLGEVYIDEDDDYTKLLCYTCYNFIKAAVLFKRAAKRTDGLLRQTVKEEDILDDSQDSKNDYSGITTCDTKKTKKSSYSEYITVTQVRKIEKNETVEYAAKVTCHICNKVLSRSYFKQHLTMHDPDHKRFVCEVCGKSFRLRCAYYTHSLKHKNDFPYKCKFCPYKASSAGLLTTHLRTHTGDYRYKCTECSARFLCKSNLNRHMLKHKEPQFECDICKQPFRTNPSLQRHFEMKHSSSKNVVCDMCGKVYGNRNAMMKHQRRIHKREKSLYNRMPSYLLAELKKEER